MLKIFITPKEVICLPGGLGGKHQVTTSMVEHPVSNAGAVQ